MFQIPENSGAFRLNRSFSGKNPGLGPQEKAMVFREEPLLADWARADFQFSFDQFQELMQKPRPLSYQDARSIARVEAASLLLEEPNIAITMAGGLSAYRLSRTFELSGAMQRAGRTLIVGSGKTIPEFFALYTAPPALEVIKKLFEPGADIKLYSKLRTAEEEYNTNSLKLVEPEFLPGKATAVEPHPDFHQQVKKFPRYVTWQETDLDFLPQTLGEALNSGAIQGPYNTILWHRADPLVFTLDEPTRKKPLPTINDHSIFLATAPLLQHLEPGGTFLFSVGSGNSEQEEKYRQIAVKCMTRVLGQKIGLQVLPDFPKTIDSQEDSRFFAGLHGILNGVIARKTN